MNTVQATLDFTEQPEVDLCLGDKLLQELERLNEMGEQMNNLLNKMLLELNDEVHEKYTPKKQVQKPKEIIISMEALEVLKNCTVEGKVVKLPPQQLDRKDYEAVKNKLELIGGKWKGGKIAGFVFQEDPTELLEQIANGEDRNLKKEYQFFGTPDELAEQMVQRAFEFTPWMDADFNKLPCKILEPSAGQGAIVKAINRFTGGLEDVKCYEAMPLNQTLLQKISTVVFLGEDFFQAHPDDMYDIIIANPPFTKNQDIEHIQKMYEVLAPGGRLVTLASPSWQTGSQKKQVQFREWLDAIGAEIEEVPAGTFKESGTNIRTLLITINKAA